MSFAAIGFGGVAAICFSVALLLMFKKYWPNAQPWLMLIAGCGLAGGLTGVLVTKVAGALTSASSVASRAVFATGAAAGGAILAIVLGIYLFIHMKPKGQRPTKFTRWIALIYPSVLFAVGGAFLGISTTASDLFAAVAREVGSVVDQVINGSGR